ncbi:hypothetical protein G3A43_07430 [Paraburkholderia aspalathi]|nr:hypothetical protein [Paraburkholderia aspalathi]MBK3780085.1 hypothetical protein [Paraburkholderia aspalathi]
MESNLLAVAVLCWLSITRERAFQPAAIASFVARLYELNAGLFKLAPTGTRTPGGIWQKEEEFLYAQAQNLVSIFGRNTGFPLALYYNADIPEQHPRSRLRLEIVGTANDHRQPLYLQAEQVQAADTADAEEKKYAHETEVLQHRIGWNVWGEGSEEIDELDSASSDHIDSQIRYGFSEGELNISDNDGNTYRGYWEIL